MDTLQFLSLILLSLTWNNGCFGQSCNSPQVAHVLKEMSKLCNKLKMAYAPVPQDCAEWYQKGFQVNGVYEINPDGLGKFKVFCDMTTQGGGWTVFQRRIDGSVNFYRSWREYKNGFGDKRNFKEFWLGNDYLNRITTKTDYILRIDMQDTSGNKRYAAYNFFAIASEAQKYKLSLGTFSGNAGDSLTYHKNQPFSTKDQDNDAWSSNCAQRYKGAWWYKACHLSNLNGQYLNGPHTTFADGINWKTWKGYYYSLKGTEMKIRPKKFPACKQ